MQKRHHSWPVHEILVLACGIAAYWIFPDDLGLLTTIVVGCIFALSLNFVLGQAGIASMGHAALFGAGAYAAGLFALHLSPSPLYGLGVGALAGALVAFISGAILLRAQGLTLVMLTIATSQLLLEVANRLRDVTGGDDGLSGFSVAPLFGTFAFDFIGVTGYFYALALLLLVYASLRILVASPFGLTARAIRQDAGRVAALGGRVYRHKLAVYTIGGVAAGLAGALSAQTTKVASLSMLDFQQSAAVLIMVVLGGTARLEGAIFGTLVFMVIQHFAANVNPQHWLLAIGCMLVFTMLVLPGGLVQLVDRFSDWRKRTQREGGRDVA
jgi:branched-chain amino acid transport system permease protein